MSRMRTKLVRNLTRDEYRRCQRLTLPDGSMRRQLAQVNKDGGDGARVFMLEDEGRLVAWALLFDAFHSDFRFLGAFREPWAYFYTRKTCRRKGHGTRLYRTVKRHQADAKVCWMPGAGDE